VVAKHTCGDQLKSEDEECDCGTAEECTASGADKCCDASTCKLKTGATCALGQCCNTATCSFIAAGTLCREAKNSDCDLPEYCSGSDLSCPGDLYKQDGLHCKSDESFCYKGVCAYTAKEQCGAVYGSDVGLSEDESCWDENPQGTEFFNCGPIGQTKSGTWTKCPNYDDDPDNFVFDPRYLGHHRNWDI
jgi:disintegrin and metalloproteinase domain-containing protein 9